METVTLPAPWGPLVSFSVLRFSTTLARTTIRQRHRCWTLVLVVTWAGALTGCRSFWPSENEAIEELQINAVANPLSVQYVDPDWAMTAVSDELDDYFRIHREERLRITDGIISEGWIKTFPQIGSTYLEPWRKDSTFGFEKAHATLQTVRRFAEVRVIPNQNSYLLDVKVYKELEDLAEPEHSTVSSRLYRHDNSLDNDREDPLVPQPNRGWIPMGRDFSLEQKILTNLAERFREKCQQ